MGSLGEGNRAGLWGSLKMGLGFVKNWFNRFNLVEAFGFQAAYCADYRFSGCRSLKPPVLQKISDLLGDFAVKQ